MRATGVISLLLLLACLQLSAKQPRWFVDRNLVYEQGSALSSRYLAAKHPDFVRKIDTILAWVVRVELRHGISKDGYVSNHGTGVILPDGKVITAKHVMTKNVKDPAGKIEVYLTTTDARVFTAKVTKKGEADWMILQMDLTPEQAKKISQSPIRLVPPKKDEIAVFFGYPARLGLDENGKVQSFHKGNKKKKIPVSQLRPMLVVGSVADTKVMTVKPLAGFPPVGGMSGGPIFNLQGEVIAAQHSVTKTTEDATGKVLKYTVDAVPSTLLKP